MDRFSAFGYAAEDKQIETKDDLEPSVLRNKLISLTLDWESAALTLDAQRYNPNGPLERESLRDSANTYRKCISELSEIISDKLSSSLQNTLNIRMEPAR
jgi:hypothetical protein